MSSIPSHSAIPDFYYFCFGAYEPFLTTLGFLGSLVDPIAVGLSSSRTQPRLNSIYPPGSQCTSFLAKRHNAPNHFASSYSCNTTPTRPCLLALRLRKLICTLRRTDTS
ncbi:hypothetical protein CVT24_004054 [Panaeolus cyanescens]|uniref:Uncharacterized protein n=1 Tax=Panaeolus cyanescens TaxID=181874 RepID=A0A409Y6H1_9AGAR|nr:hypothetical protein CVT24_004054 [Panaeolus cyanescens]